jgi:quercetin dioxygenase-like cupin family protein
MTALQTSTEARLFHRPAATGPAYWGPGDHYTFLVTGEESGGAYFAMEALVPTGGGPPPHVHRREDETFYLLEGEIEFRLGDETITAGAGDFVNVPRGTVHSFRNAGSETARMVLTFTPAGMEHFFEETLEPAPNGARTAPDNADEVAARYVAAAPDHGLEFV